MLVPSSGHSMHSRASGPERSGTTWCPLPSATTACCDITELDDTDCCSDEAVLIVDAEAVVTGADDGVRQDRLAGGMSELFACLCVVGLGWVFFT